MVKSGVRKSDFQLPISSKKDVLKNFLTFPCKLRDPKSLTFQHLQRPNRFHEEEKIAWNITNHEDKFKKCFELSSN